MASKNYCVECDAVVDDEESCERCFEPVCESCSDDHVESHDNEEEDDEGY